MKESIDGHTIANEIRMTREVLDVAFLLVEGGDDRRFFRTLVDQEACDIIVAHGRPNVILAIELLNEDRFRGALAIVDADFSRVTGESLPEDNVTLTDGHDLECMLSSSHALDKVLAAFGKPDRIAKFAEAEGGLIGLALAKNATPLGYLLLVSLRHNLGLRFEDLSFRTFVDGERLTVDLPSMIRTVLNHSQKHDLKAEWLRDEVQALAVGDHDPWEIARGHDIVAILSIGLQRTFAARRQQTVSPEVLERDLRLAYDRADFLQTKLHRSVVGWEDRNRPYRVLATP